MTEPTSDPTNDDPAPSGAWPPWVETWILPYIDDFMLWPVLAALLGHVVVILVPLELGVLRGPDLFSMLVLALLLAGTGEVIRMEWRARGRLGGLTAVVVGLWVVSFPCSWYANASGIY